MSLNPDNPKAARILSNLKAGKFDTNKSSSTTTNSTSGDGIHQRKKPSTAPKPEEPKLGEDYTVEQKTMVDKLKK